MDNCSSEFTPMQKQYIFNGSRKRPLEKVQESQLQQQSFSTMKQPSSSTTNIIESNSSNFTYMNNVTLSPSAENRTPCNLKKLRLLSPGGKDLGEFNLKLKSVDSLKGSKITISKSNFKLVDKPLTILQSSSSHTTPFPRILKQGSKKILKSNLMELTSYKSSFKTSDSYIQQEVNLLPKIKVLFKNKNAEDKMKNQMCNINGIDDKASPTNNFNFIKVQETATENGETCLTAHTTLKNCESLDTVNCCVGINFNNQKDIPLVNKVHKISKGKCIAVIKNTKSGKIVTSLKNVNLLQGCKADKNLNNSDLYDEKKLSHIKLYDKNNFLPSKTDIPKSVEIQSVEKQNVMTIIPNNETLLFNQNGNFVQENNTLVVPESTDNIKDINHSTVKCNTNCDSTQSESLKMSRNNLAVNNVEYIPELQQIRNINSNVQHKNLPQNNLVSSLDIIKKAMDSVTDNELRELALKALAECGIGIEKHIPVHSPQDYKAVNDTQVQTEVFGLLDSKVFVLIDKNMESIQRITQKNFHTIFKENLTDKSNNSHSNNNIDQSKTSNIIENTLPFDLDSFIDEYFDESSDAYKIREILSKTKTRCDGLLEHLQRDFQCVKQYDQNGMLSIHNAVMGNNIFLVRRYLLVLKHAKQSVDIATEDGITSLELAIKYDVCHEIVQLLLDSGAQPVTPKSLHESAVIIASKQSSSMLSMLISRVLSPKLLDQIDSDGFAALHYCSIHGNLQGVKALISAGATVNLRDMKSGRTPLFHAIDNNRSTIMRVLINAGAVTTIPNYAGQTALSIIADQRYTGFK
ncbi:hypothetical protein PUN28_016268 [Cardiocondyla obscurior]|uniref:Ankyrin repeat protein n=3 Tax=Cardiocondyla obscurior TaxID=286306 RepID=A0AAW2EU27_9HYME